MYTQYTAHIFTHAYLALQLFPQGSLCFTDCDNSSLFESSQKFDLTPWPSLLQLIQSCESAKRRS